MSQALTPRCDPLPQAGEGKCNYLQSALHCVFFTSQALRHSSIFLLSFESALHGFMHSDAVTLHFVWH